MRRWWELFFWLLVGTVAIGALPRKPFQVKKAPVENPANYTLGPGWEVELLWDAEAKPNFIINKIPLQGTPAVVAAVVLRGQGTSRRLAELLIPRPANASATTVSVMEEQIYGPKGKCKEWKIQIQADGSAAINTIPWPFPEWNSMGAAHPPRRMDDGSYGLMWFRQQPCSKGTRPKADQELVLIVHSATSRWAEARLATEGSALEVGDPGEGLRSLRANSKNR